MADVEQDEEQKKKAEGTAPAAKIGWMEDHAFSTAMQFVRQVEHLLSVHGGNVPEEEKKVMNATWRRLGPLDKLMVQQKLGSKLNSAIN